MATFHHFPRNILICAMLLLATIIKPSLSYPQYEYELYSPSSISLPPSNLPKMPKSSFISPALPPDIMPVFPSPVSGAGDPPSTNEFPTIPSSPSPPNPDDLDPNSAFAPFGAMAAAASSSSWPVREAKQLPFLVIFSGFAVLMWWLV